ncbi:MAG TPA: uracil-DNA glycosylase family protein, partial [Polyangiaceae bacterium LLY-WYZ-15_(1-7)]|nr:uracil-DNA glycosylase family protein [Polyangiaceae bacterium LLY-WYZ-15_(1-7)]
MEDDARAELQELADAARALLRWEEELGGVGVPAVEPPPFPASTAPFTELVGDAAMPPAEPRPPVRQTSSSTSAAAPRPPAASQPPAREPAPTPQPEPAREPEPRAAEPSTHPGDVIAELRVLQEDAAECTRCRLHEGRTRSVFARGTPFTDLAFVGEGPGYHEDQQGLPFVGKAGHLLDKMIAAMGYERDAVYICNVVKCRPPQNRTPKPDEAGACARFLEPQLDLVAPKVIVALGRCAAENLGVVEPGGRGWRGRWGS